MKIDLAVKSAELEGDGISGLGHVHLLFFAKALGEQVQLKL